MALSPKVRFQILQRDGFTCAYCGQRPPAVKLHVDHIVPRSKGGSDKAENLQAACNRCNAGKAARHLEGIDTEEQSDPIQELSFALSVCLAALTPFMTAPHLPIVQPENAEDTQLAINHAFMILMDRGDLPEGMASPFAELIALHREGRLKGVVDNG